MAAGAGGEFNYLEFFKEEIRNENPTIKIGAVNRLHLIASALGPQDTVSRLLPYVFQVVQEEPLCNDDEFLYSMARQCAVLLDYMDGDEDKLIAPLEHLAAQEETVIRDQAIDSLCKVVEKRNSLAQSDLVATLGRLSGNTNSFTARVSACALLPTVYRYVTNAADKQTLRKACTMLCTDETPMVRRAAAHRLGDFVHVCAKQDLMNDMISVYKLLSQEDTQDTIRVASVHTTLVIGKMLNIEENQQHTVSVVKEAAEDRSWRVRLTVAKHFDQLCEAFGPELTSQTLMGPFIRLMQDNEQEVRKEAVRVIESCLNLAEPFTSEQLQTYIVPQITQLGNDPAAPVRAALAQILGPMAKALGRDVTQRQLLSVISELMKDEFHDVRLNSVSHAGLICEVLSVDGLVESLLRTVQGLIIDNHWRIRQSVVEQVPKLSRLFGMEMFQSKLETIFLSSLKDSVHSVRQAAILHLQEIADTFGSQWTVEHLLPKLVEQYSASVGYVNRVTTLHVLPRVSGVMSPDQIIMFILPLLIKATKDSVPNVKFCACRTIMWMMENHNLGQQTILMTIKPCLLELEHDNDIDVQYYARRALLLCQGS
eukprot:TRINITY_DN19417_c0_g1_i1.p1 TRINITY_DN19417_c0_g1~~TRINITY_DN19417_c0_g1_i1.p1  ORF type:complete len:596 (-),score=110.56 TRINITY_DN19417_c0_g1_i1:125-1912(-)